MQKTFALLLSLAALTAFADPSPLLSAKESKEAEDLALEFRTIVSKYDAFQGIPLTLKRSDAVKLVETQAAARLKRLDEANAKAVENIVAQFKKQTFKNTPALILVPDFHTSKEDSTIIANLLDATPSDHILALEGLSFGWKKGPVEIAMTHDRKVRLPADARVSGIESPDYLAMQAPYQLLQPNLFKGTDKERAAARKMVLQMLVMGYGEDLIDVAATEMKLSESMARFLDPLKKKDLETVTLALEKGAKNVPPDDEWKALTTVLWARNCKYYFQKSSNAEEVKRLSDKLTKNPDDRIAMMVLWHLEAYELRNVTWTTIVSAIYAKVATTEQPLYVVMGASHILPMRTYLEQVLGPHGVKITTQFRQTHLKQLREDAKANAEDFRKVFNVLPE